MTHRIMSKCSYHGATFRSLSLFKEVNWPIYSQQKLQTNLFDSEMHRNASLSKTSYQWSSEILQTQS